MSPASFALPRSGLTLLCLGAHPDDIEIGAGGTVLRWIGEKRVRRVVWVVFSGAGTEREREAKRGARRFLRNVPSTDVRVEGFRDGFFPGQHAAIKELFEGLKDVAPDVILTHQTEEHHQDHAIVGELTWNTFRDHVILEYEVPKYDGLRGRPNLYVSLPPAIRRRKVDALMSVFGTQRSKGWFTPETFEGLMRLRGVESAAPDGYAEAFVARKVLVG